MRQFLVTVLLLSLSGCRQPSKPEPKPEKGGLVGLADCLTGKGVVYYGASWCSFCRRQQAMFGEAFSRVNHVACEDPQGDPDIDPGCIEGGGYCYPTWAFPGGKRMCGVKTPSELAKESGCPDPGTP
jgi:hypothetical protein